MLHETAWHFNEPLVDAPIEQHRSYKSFTALGPAFSESYHFRKFDRGDGSRCGMVGSGRYRPAVSGKTSHVIARSAATKQSRSTALRMQDWIATPPSGGSR
jgi:hypothetical protein